MANSLSYFIGVTSALIMVMFLVQVSMDKVSESEGMTGLNMFNYENSSMRQFDTTGNYDLTQNAGALLPSSEQNTNVDEDQGNFFSDTFATFKNWILDSTGGRFILNLVNALPNLLKYMFSAELQPLAFAIGYFWFVSFIVSIIFWFKGGGY